MSPVQDSVSSEKEDCSPVSISLLENDSVKIKGPKLGKRHVQVLFHGLFYTVSACVHNMMPICLVAMTDPTASNNNNIPTYEWTQKGTILSIFFWGKMLAQTLSGWLSTRYGGKWILISTNVISSILVLLQPTMVYTFGYEGIVVGRFFQGVFNGFTFASIHSLLAKWSPPSERGIFSVIACSGLTAGCVITIFTSGQIAASWYGWPMVFYFFGSMQFLSSLLFVYFGRDSPAHHPTITEQETAFIEHGAALKKDDKVLSTPWLKIFTSSSFLALMTVQCSFYWGFFMLISETPIYFNKVMGLDMKSNSIRSALPHLVKLCLGYIFIFISDWLSRKKIFTTAKSRKFLVTIGSLIPCISLSLIANCDKNDALKATILMVVGVGFLSSHLAGHMVNHIDLSPNHAGTLMGIATQIAFLCSGIGLLLVQHVVTDETDPSQWKIVFYFTSGIFAVTSLIFNVYGSGKVQPWNEST